MVVFHDGDRMTDLTSTWRCFEASFSGV